eukprot:gene21511-26092_t
MIKESWQPEAIAVTPQFPGTLNIVAAVDAKTRQNLTIRIVNNGTAAVNVTLDFPRARHAAAQNVRQQQGNNGTVAASVGGATDPYAIVPTTGMTTLGSTITIPPASLVIITALLQ